MQESAMSSVTIPEVVAISFASQCECEKVREENQGTVRHTSARLGDLLIVADGIGSKTGGSRASQMALDTISSSVEGMPAFFPPEIAVEEAICHANAAIAAAPAEPDCLDSRMGSTVVVALLRTEADHTHAPVQAIIGHVGDGRAYLVHNQKLTLLTSDHSAVPDQITLQEGDTRPDATMPTWYLGKELNVRVGMREVQLEAGDSLMLCSDGLWGCVPEPEIERILADGARSVEEASRALLNLAHDAGGENNVAIEIARLTPSSESVAPADCTVELRSEVPPEIESVREFTPASDTSQSDWSASQLALETDDSGKGSPPPPKSEKVLSFVKDLGRRHSDKDSIDDKPATEAPPAPSASGVQPTISWPTPEPVDYGTELSSVQLNATASVPGRFLYTPGPGYVLPAGTHTIWVTFFPADSPQDSSVLASVSIAVLRVTPSIQWPTPSIMPPGVALGAAQLNASASVPGTLEYSPAAGEVLADGTHTLSVTFTPKDIANYTTVQATVSVTVAKTVPDIEWASPYPIPFGTPLGAAQLNASASVAGTFEYSPAAGEVLSAGSHKLSVTFIPSDGTTYSRAGATVRLTVTRATPAIAWPTPEKINFGVPLGKTQLNATGCVPGTFVYTPGPGAILSAGEHTPSVIFTPFNLSDYTPAQVAVSLSVIKAIPVISWPVPDPVNSATPLGPAQLNASASVPGTFTYSPAAGQTLEPGAHTLSVTFVPADSVNYTPVEASVSLTVTEIMPVEITWLNPPSISYGTVLGEEQLNASSSVPGSFLYAPAAGEVLPAGKHKLSVIFTPANQQKYAKVQASVTLIVEELPHVAWLLRATSQTPIAPGVSAQPAAAPAAEREVLRMGDQPAQNLQSETRTYRGAIYEKGDDGQWHLQRR
jgi:serine/threonine protein phosphatase PrpC